MALLMLAIVVSVVCIVLIRVVRRVIRTDGHDVGVILTDTLHGTYFQLHQVSNVDMQVLHSIYEALNSKFFLHFLLTPLVPAFHLI